METLINLKELFLPTIYNNSNNQIITIIFNKIGTVQIQYNKNKFHTICQYFYKKRILNKMFLYLI